MGGVRPACGCVGQHDIVSLLRLQAVRMGKQFAQLVGHTNHKQKIHYVQKLTNENLSLKKVP